MVSRNIVAGLIYFVDEVQLQTVSGISPARHERETSESVRTPRPDELDQPWTNRRTSTRSWRALPTGSERRSRLFFEAYGLPSSSSVSAC